MWHQTVIYFLIDIIYTIIDPEVSVLIFVVLRKSETFWDSFP